MKSLVPPTDTRSTQHEPPHPTRKRSTPSLTVITASLEAPLGRHLLPHSKNILTPQLDPKRLNVMKCFPQTGKNVPLVEVQNIRRPTNKYSSMYHDVSSPFQPERCRPRESGSLWIRAAWSRKAYLDLARIFRRFRFSLRIRFLRHLARIFDVWPWR